MSSDAGTGTEGPGLRSLPSAARREVLAAAAACLDALPAPEVPVALRRVRSFAPARRAAAGAPLLSAALEDDPAFRQRVAAVWRGGHPRWAAELDEGGLPTGARPAELGCALYLLRPPGWATALAEASTQVDDEERRRVGEQELARRDAELARTASELEQSRARIGELQRELAEVASERDALRKEVRRERSDADRARSAARRAADEAAAASAARDEAQSRAAAARRELEDARTRVGAEQEERRRLSHRLQELDDVRARLLLDTLVEAAAGLRRELALPPADRRPADVVAEIVGEEVGTLQGRTPHAVPETEPALLDRWLRLPRAHLMVDGYNVTKTAHPQRSLAEQRRWLVEALGALAARTGAEITCCFDGAAAQQEPGVLTRGVRVLFSGAGVEADELIRRLVRAEPEGRPLVVVSSDSAVARGVVAAGARSAASSALVRHLGR